MIWRPFLLNPDMPRMGMPRPDYVVRKFGGEDRAKRLYATISEVGRHEGLEFRFDRIRRTPSSIDAHRLVRFAAGYGRADSLVEALFAAHFTDGHDVGDHGVLIAVATACGMDPVAVRRFLASDAEAEASTPTTSARTDWASTASPASSSTAHMPSQAPRSRK